MGITYSIDQQKVINSRNKNLLVSAAAGAGKTAVLTERIIRRVMDEENPVDIDRILVVTFTNAAAQEMRERIRKKLEDELALNPDNQRLQKQATLIHNAQISTIDGFCLNLVKNHFHKIDLDPVFRIASEGEIKLIKKDLIKSVIEEAYEAEDKEFYNLVDCYSSSKDDAKIEDLIEEVYASAMSYPWPEKWLNDCASEYDCETYEKFRISPLIKEFERKTKENIEECISLTEQGIAICKDESGPLAYLPAFESDRDFLLEMKIFSDENDLEGIRKLFSNYSEKPIGRVTAKTPCDEVLKERAKSIRERRKNIITDMKENYFSSSLVGMYEEFLTSGRLVKCLVDLVLKYKKAFDEEKRDKGIIDFSDMSHFAIKILIDDFTDMDHFVVSEVAKEYRDFFEEVMIDEYQDSNLVQEIILSSISREGTDRAGNRFIVGDVKQSIYRFRLARPDLFTEHDRKYSSPENEDSEVIRLMENYRSRCEVVDSVNAVFETVMHENLGGVEYGENERLNAKADYPLSQESGYKTKLILVEKHDKNAEDAQKGQVMYLSELVKDIIAHKMVYNPEKKTLEKASYKDITILFRGPSSWTETIKDIFGKSGIPFHIEGKGTFYEATEIKTVMNLLRVIDNPLNDIALFGVMISYFGNFTEEECLKIKAEGEGTEYYLWDKVIGYSNRHKEDKKTKKFIEMINRYRYEVTFTSIENVVTRIVTKTGYIHYVSALADGRQREANLEALIKKASDYSKSSFSGLFHFLRYVELVSQVSDEDEISVFDENADVVKIMSIHKSKGLEFPYCIVAGMDKEFNEKDSSGDFLLDIEMGIGSAFVDPERRIKWKTLKQKFISEKIKNEGRGEEIRVFYVAMTRAKEQLYLVGSAKEANDYLEKDEKDPWNTYLKFVKQAYSKAQNRQYFDVEYVDIEKMIVNEAERIVDLKKLRVDLEESSRTDKAKELSSEIENNISFDYKYKYLEKLYTKTTVSELKMDAMEETQGETQKLFEERERAEYVPSFAGGERAVSGTDRGSAYHKLLQLIDFSKELSWEEWKSQMALMIENEYMTKEEQELVPMGKIKTFMESSLAGRMHKAAMKGQLFKEQPFVMGVKANRVNEEFPEDETILVQGVIDAFFSEDDEIVVLDYKTDRVESGEELSNRYKKQIELYSEALAAIANKPVKERLLYSFGLNGIVVVK